MRRQRHLKLLVAGVVIGLLTLGLASAGASSASMSRSYHAPSSITDGSIVSIDSQRPGYVQPANTGNGSRLLGVAVASNGSLLAVDQTTDTIQVASSGTVNVLASTLNGAINIGDQVAVSPFNGVGMKALPGSHVIGLAQSALNAMSDGITTRQVTDKEGKINQIRVGYIRISIAIGIDTATGSEASLNSLQKLAQSLAKHPVSTVRIILSVVVAIVALVSLIVLIYASIHASILSIGRNPLAQYSILRTLSTVLGMAALIAILAGLIIFFLLR